VKAGPWVWSLISRSDAHGSDVVHVEQHISRFSENSSIYFSTYRNRTRQSDHVKCAASILSDVVFSAPLLNVVHLLLLSKSVNMHHVIRLHMVCGGKNTETIKGDFRVILIQIREAAALMQSCSVCYASVLNPTFLTPSGRQIEYMLRKLRGEKKVGRKMIRSTSA